MTLSHWIMAAFASLFFLTGCSGSAEKTTPNFIDLTLKEISVNGEPVALVAQKTGPYEITLSAALSTASIQVVASQTDRTLYYNYTNSERTIALTELIDSTTFDVPLAEGTTLVHILVTDGSDDPGLAYTLTLFKTSDDAALASYLFYAGNDTGQSALTLTPTFDPKTYDYTATVSYDTCFIYGQFYTEYADNRVTVNDESIDNTEVYARNLEPGDNIFDTRVSAGEGAREVVYSVSVERAQPTEAQQNANARLADLHVEGYDLEFLCGQNIYGVTVNSDTQSLIISADPEVDDISMIIDDKDLEARQPIEIPLDEGDTYLSLIATSLDGNHSHTYTLYVSRRNTRQIRVTSAEALQTALRNANPNDEIVVAPGVYAGDVANSGHGEAHFYSNRSGTALLPIRLRGEDEDLASVLRGSESDEATVFLLSGDHWRIDNLGFEVGHEAIRLDHANDNRFAEVTAAEAETAIALVESNHNRFEQSTFSTQSGTSQPLVIVGAEGAVSDDNAFTRNTFSGGGETPLIRLSANADQSDLDSNRFLSQTTENNPSSMVEVLGNNTLIRFNSFYPADSDTAPSVTVAGGQNTAIYSNWLITNQQPQAMVHSESGGQVQAGDNYTRTKIALEEDYVPATYSGGAIEVDQLPAPVVQLALTASPTLCLDLEEIDGTQFVVINPCLASHSQYWQWEMAGDGYKYLRNLSVDEKPYLMAVPEFTSTCETIASATSITYLSEKYYGYAQQWYAREEEDGVMLVNRQNENYGLTIAGNTFTAGNGAVVCPLTSAKRQTFELRPVATD